MTLRDIFCTAGLYLAYKIADKFVDSNLPDLHYTKVARTLKIFALMCYAFAWLLLVRAGIIKLKLEQQLLLIIITLIYALMKPAKKLKDTPVAA